MKDSVYGKEMPSHIHKPFSILLLSSVSATCVDQRGYCAGFRSTSSLDRALPPSSPLCSEQDRLYLLYNWSNSSRIHTGVQMSSGGLISDLSFLLIWFWGCITHWDPLPCSVRVRILWSRGIAQFACHRRGSLWGSHQEEITTSRSDADEKNTDIVTSFVQVFFFLLLDCSDSWWKCDRCFNKDVLSLFWRQPSVSVLLCHAWCDWTSHSLVKG